MTLFLGLLTLVLLLIGLALLWLARWGRERAGLPAGRVIYMDMGGRGRQRVALVSRRHGLSGRPDYLVENRNHVVPVEIKTGLAPPQPHEGHILQLAAYCLLAEETYGYRPTHGIIRYADRSFVVDYTPALEARLLKTLELMRADLLASDVARSHKQPSRCRGCGYRDICDQAL